jgi:hypothetical protein
MFYLVRPNTDSKVIVGHRRRSTGNRQIWAEKQPPFPVIRKAVILDASGNPNEKLSNIPCCLPGHACHQRPAIMASYVLCLCFDYLLEALPNGRSQNLAIVDYWLKPVMGSKIAASQIE